MWRVFPCFGPDAAPQINGANLNLLAFGTPSEARLIRDEIITAETTDLRAPAAGLALNLPAVADRLLCGAHD